MSRVNAEQLGNGRYHLRRMIGSGGTADVYLAEDVKLHRPVALKLLHRRVTDDANLLARLRAEVRISRTLSHPGIVDVLDYSPDHPAFLVMRHMAGGDLRRRLLGLGRLPAGEVSRIAKALLAALEHAHAQGVVHRDLKPRNVLFTENGEPAIADFGLARSVTAAGLFGEGTIAGTPEYTAPETITASLWDARSDLYALGCTLFEAATGEPPHVANTPAEVLRMQVETPAPHVPDEIAAAGSHLALLLQALLHKDPNARPQTAAEALAILQTSADEPAPAAITETRPCPSCGASLSSAYGWCFTCGRPDLPVVRDRNGYSLLVTGPGKRGEKVSPDFRDMCCRVTAAAGLDPASLRKAVPRLPFVLASQVDYGGATRLRDELLAGGAQVMLVGAGESSKGQMLRAVSRKALTMAPRVYLVIATMGGTWINLTRNGPPGAILVIFAALLAAVPAVLVGAFSRSDTKWSSDTRTGAGRNVTRLLATVRDPLIHARMKSIAESSRLLAAGTASLPAADGEAPLEPQAWADTVIERAAGLCLGLDAARSGRIAGERALIASASQDAEETAGMLRNLDSLHTRILERMGRTALDIRELSLQMARTRQSGATLDVRRLRELSARLGDEGEAWREIQDATEGAS